MKHESLPVDLIGTIGCRYRDAHGIVWTVYEESGFLPEQVAVIKTSAQPPAGPPTEANYVLPEVSLDIPTKAQKRKLVANWSRDLTVEQLREFVAGAELVL